MKKLVIALFAVCVPACGLAVTGVGSWKVVQRYPPGGAGVGTISPWTSPRSIFV